ncbi:RHS repeat-associated core domain-containing protein [Pseudomonas putida]|uniref:RHS repeat-associated core domain-containing protein n=1 Tax=Pseudomonas putida TaxID=303 RepID=UPI003D99B319
MPFPRETLLCRYHYNALDQLVARALPGESELQCFYNKNRLATETKGAIRYSVVQYGDQLLAQQRSEGDVIDTTLLASDKQRSVNNAVKADQQPQPFAYSPYGHRHPVNGLFSLLGFTGERPDPVTGHYLLGNGHRAFNPVLMRFNSPDRLSPFGAKIWNAYAYCVGDPVNLDDPTGMAPRISWAGAIQKVKDLIIIKKLNTRLLARREKLQVDVFKKTVAFAHNYPTLETLALKKSLPQLREMEKSNIAVPHQYKGAPPPLSVEPKDIQMLERVAIRDESGKIINFKRGDWEFLMSPYEKNVRSNKNVYTLTLRIIELNRLGASIKGISWIDNINSRFP